MSEKYRLIKHNENLAEIVNNRGVGLLFLVDEDCERKLEIIVDLLNEKQSTIKQLEKDIKDLNFVINFQEKEIDGLKALLKEKECFEEAYYISKKENDNKFEFNVNQAKAYHIKSISPNGIIRLGNGHKAQFRMKDVREINNELPPFEDFNREIFQQIKNKFHTKFDDGVTGRIIYNIYNGTFEGVI